MASSLKACVLITGYYGAEGKNYEPILIAIVEQSEVIAVLNNLVQYRKGITEGDEFYTKPFLELTVLLLTARELAEAEKFIVRVLKTNGDKDPHATLGMENTAVNTKVTNIVRLHFYNDDEDIQEFGVTLTTTPTAINYLNEPHIKTLLMIQVLETDLYSHIESVHPIGETNESNHTQCEGETPTQ